VAIHWRQGWWLGSNGSFQPRLGSQLSGEHCTRFHTPSQPCCLAEPPKSALSQQKQAGHYAYIAYAARATQWQHNGNTMALKNGSQEYILPAIMHQMVPAGFSKDLPLHHLHPTHHWPHEHMRLPLSAMGHGMGCTCLFSMIQSAAGSKLHPLPNCQLCQATVMDQVRQPAGDRQTSRSAPPHNHHLTHHCTSCTQGIPYATSGIGPEPRAQLLQLEPAQSTQHPTSSASSPAACCMPLHAWCLLPPCLAMLAGHNQTSLLRSLHYH